jgi:hypothetical protein
VSDKGLKEWALICRALETGLQTLLLRKGGIREGAGGFQPEHQRFWLYPTQFHQGAEQLEPAFAPLLNEVEVPSQGLVPLRLFAAVESVTYLDQLESALALQGLHGWSEDVIKQRFVYRQTGLYLFVLRVFRSELVHTVEESAAMAGCKSWVGLPAPLPTGVLTPVLNDGEWQAMSQAIDAKLLRTR